MRLRSFGAAAVAALLVSTVQASTGEIVIDVRDSMTGGAVAAHITVPGQRAPGRRVLSSEVDGEPRVRLELAAGSHRFHIAAARYAPIDTQLSVESAGTLAVTVLLDPERLPDELRPEVVRARLRHGLTLLHGHVTDQSTGEALGGATVRSVRSSATVATDARGYFTLEIPASPAAEGEIPDSDDLVIESRGYKTYTITNTLLLDATDTHYIVQMERGSGATGRTDDHKIWLHRPDGEHPHHPDDHGHVRDLRVETNRELKATADSITVPDSIRVGFTCSCATCSSVQVMSMKTYVKRGLNDEWIASWHANSLRAGAVAYRSYGAWYVEHPRTSTYDICSTTCCQVNDSDTSTATTDAAAVTDGYVLQKDGAIFRSEYASENNSWDDTTDTKSCSNKDLSCGDGYAGSPSTNWPCLSDSVCSGKGCFGHGRGMCQWGTQRWAYNQGRDWPWILDHYYNDNGNPGGLRAAYLYPHESIVDNATANRFTASSNWSTSSYNSQRYGADYRYATPEAVSDAAWYKVIVPAAGDYEVYTWYPSSSGYNSATPFVIVTTSGNVTKYVDQQTNGGTWVSLGIYTLDAGDYNVVGVSRWTSTSGYVIADAVKLVQR